MSGKFNLVLTVLLVGCALSLINAQYQSRHLFIELDRANSQARLLNLAWSQLQVDQSTLGKHERIEAIARTELEMTPLTAGRIQYLTEEQK